MQLTADGTLDYFSAELRKFVGTLPLASRDSAKTLAEDLLTYFGRLYRDTDALAKKIAALGDAGTSRAADGEAIQAWKSLRETRSARSPTTSNACKEQLTRSSLLLEAKRSGAHLGHALGSWSGQSPA